MSLYCTSQIKSINFLDSSQIKTILFYTTPNIKVNNIIDLTTS